MTVGEFSQDAAGSVPPLAAVYAAATHGSTGMQATSDSGVGVKSTASSGGGVYGESDSGIGVSGASNSGNGVIGATQSTADSLLSDVAAVQGYGGGGHCAAVWGRGFEGIGVLGSSSNGGTGLSGITDSGFGVTANGGVAGTALQVIGKIEVQGDSAGSVPMRGGLTELTVINTAVTPDSLILLTPGNSPGAYLWVGERNAGSFTINASSALPEEVVIMFLIIN